MDTADNTTSERTGIKDREIKSVRQNSKQGPDKYIHPVRSLFEQGYIDQIASD